MQNHAFSASRYHETRYSFYVIDIFKVTPFLPLCLEMFIVGRSSKISKGNEALLSLYNGDLELILPVEPVKNKLNDARTSLYKPFVQKPNDSYSHHP